MRRTKLPKPIPGPLRPIHLTIDGLEHQVYLDVNRVYFRYRPPLAGQDGWRLAGRVTQRTLRALEMARAAL